MKHSVLISAVLGFNLALLAGLSSCHWVADLGELSVDSSTSGGQGGSSSGSSSTGSSSTGGNSDAGGTTGGTVIQAFDLGKLVGIDPAYLDAAFLPSGRVYVAGIANGNIALADWSVSTGGSNWFFAHGFEADGKPLWPNGKVLGGTVDGFNFIEAIQIAAFNDIVATVGSFREGAINNDGIQITAQPDRGIEGFVTFHNSVTGAKSGVGAVKITGTSEQMGMDIALDGEPRAFVAARLSTNVNTEPVGFPTDIASEEDPGLFKIDPNTGSSDVHRNLMNTPTMGQAEWPGHIALGGNKNVFISGRFATAFDTDNINFQNVGGFDVFVMMLGPSLGSLTWGKTIGGSGDDISKHLAASASGLVAVLVDSTSMNTIDLGDGFSCTPTSPQSALAIFDPNQNKTLFGACVSPNAESLAFDQNEDLVITGKYNLPIDMGCPVPTSPKGGDVFVLKLSKTGQCKWARSFGSPAATITGLHVGIGANNQVFVLGTFQDTLDLGEGKSLTAQSDPGVPHLFILHLEP